ncbi:hypothetical protein ABQF08_19200 [Xanthomonas campestris pv. campestris]|uniref:hypothetical protein n=1 Tax=Xanthomonas campestris TaxID=339 RepID=UPI0018AAA01E|nr:hypothetical protein [Xanthomonas campestris]MCC5060664.1 hypothetical protein [Xanthomonas campestris]MCF8835673.1 hypothetical protein [Xanthomonas campestris pv. campestris]MEA0717043.1 hypothetical protein [Xanthomonas campestris pv. campestris]MEA0824989.1 hypothetical protein [Xanthomonas campestris pv. campestris]MEA0836978.1 hypothetical protein [Xanthomonas campestris pv. campestris]
MKVMGSATAAIVAAHRSDRTAEDEPSPQMERAAATFTALLQLGRHAAYPTQLLAVVVRAIHRSPAMPPPLR